MKLEFVVPMKHAGAVQTIIAAWLVEEGYNEQRAATSSLNFCKYVAFAPNKLQGYSAATVKVMMENTGLQTMLEEGWYFTWHTPVGARALVTSDGKGSICVTYAGRRGALNGYELADTSEFLYMLREFLREHGGEPVKYETSQPGWKWHETSATAEE